MKQKVLLFMLLATALTAKSADYYWVGGTGNWTDVATHWATTSGGGTFHVVVPTLSDNVIFDANSFTSSGQTVTVNIASISCNNMNWTGVTNTPTLNMSNNLLYIYGSLTMVSGMNTSNFFCCTNSITFKATSTGKTITTGGKSIGQIWFDGVGGEWTLQDALSAPGGIFLVNGSFITNNNTLNIMYFSSNNSNVRNLNIGSSTINVSYGQPWEMTSTNLTFSATTPTINASGGGNFMGGGKSYHNINFTGSAAGTISNVSSANDVSFTGNGTINGASTFNNVTFGGNATINGSNTFNNISFGAAKVNTFQASTTQIVNGTFTSSSSCTGFSTFTSSTSSAATISKSSGSVTINYVNLSNITGTGGATFTANNTIASGTNTGWTVSPLSSNNLYWIGGSGNWSDGSHWSLTSGGAAYNCSPTLLDNVFFDANSFTGASQTVTADITTVSCNNMNWTGVTNTPTFNMNNKLLYIYGSLTMVSGMNTSNFFCCTNSITFKATSAGKTITTGGKSIGQIWFDGVGGEWTLQDAVSAPGGIFLVNGSFITNNNTLNIMYFSSNNSNVRNLNIGSSTINVSYGQPWEMTSTNLTFSATTPTINASGGGNFLGGGKSYHNINFTGSAAGTISNVSSANDVSFTGNGTINGASTFNNVTFGGNATINGSNTFNNLTFYSGTTNTLAAGATQTVTGTLTATGTGGFLITIQSSSATPAILSKSSGNVCFDYVLLQKITGTGGATFDAGINTHSTDLGGNTGFAFTGLCTLPPYPPYLWKGATNASWTTTTNWSPGIVPSSSSNIIISLANNAPAISTTQAVNNITINSGTSLTVTGTLQLSGTLTNNGALTATAGTIEFNGSAPQTIPASAFATNTIKNLTINNAAGVTLAGALNVTGVITPITGTLTTGGNLTLVSNSSGTARIAQGAGSYISGTVNVQQYIPGGRRAYRFLGNPFNAALNMGSLIDDIFITGDGTTAGTGGATTGSGFDATTSNSASSFWFDNNATTPGAWKAFTGTADTRWEPYKGIRVLIRGDRTQATALTGSNPTPNAVTLDVTGTLNTGNVNISVPTAGAFHLLANPYASPVDIGSVIDGLTSAVIGTQYWVWNANAAGINNRGAYVTKVVGTGAYNLAANGAFFVQPVSGTTLAFTEANKQSTASTALFRTNTMQDLLELNLLYNNGEADNMFIRNSSTAVNALDAQDGEKLLNPDINLYSLSSTANKLSLDSRPFMAVTTIPLGFTTTAAGTFSLAIANNTINSAIAIYVKDKLSNTEQLLTPSTAFTFTVTADPATQGENRFELVFRNNGALPVNITNLKAYQKNTGIQVDWNSQNEQNLNSYEVEKSKSGLNFIKVGTVVASGLTSYHWYDANPVNGNNYYRIKIVEKDGSFNYTQVVNIKIGSIKNTFSIVGNPIKNKTITLQMENVTKGNYSIKMYNNLGQSVATNTINHAGGSATETIFIGNVAAGTYQLSIVGNNHISVIKTVIIE